MIAIERRAFPTPWSLAMFVLELSKPSGMCLAAAARAERLVGYLICSRYDTVWHVMNIAVDPDHQRRGHRRRRCWPSSTRGSATPARASRSRCAARTTSRSTSTSATASARPGMRRRYYQDNGEDALIMWRTPATLAGTLDDVPEPRRRAMSDPRARDELRRHLRRGRRRRTARSRSNVISSQDVHDRFGGVVPEIASRHHLELIDAVVDEALARGGRRRSRTSTLVAATQGPGLVGALLVGLSTAKALAAARELPFAPVDHLQGHVAANFLARARRDSASSRRSSA